LSVLTHKKLLLFIIYHRRFLFHTDLFSYRFRPMGSTCP
jgi:hypothetical protein